MKKLNWINPIKGALLVGLLLSLTGCAGQNAGPTDGRHAGGPPADSQVMEDHSQQVQPSIEGSGRRGGSRRKEQQRPAETPPSAELMNGGTLSRAEAAEETNAEPLFLQQTAWAKLFHGINGSAVLYDPAENCYRVYNQEAAIIQRSPCSTFKIISSLLALENGIVDPGQSVRTWSGEIFWNGDWNRDIGFDEAFRTSCVWYFRQVIDEIGKDRIQDGLDHLAYGNRDISDWDGRLNSNNQNPALTGFWIESSLKISPKEQTEVMERIFGVHSDYSRETIDRLMQVMLLPESEETGIMIYGKTGMGKAAGVVIDAWYTGFADLADERIYFCVHLDETANEEVSSSKAREIAVEILEGYFR